VSAFADFRAEVVAALALLDEDWAVHGAPVDAVTPPCFVIVWPEPWLTPQSVCSYRAQLQVICVAVRIDPAPGYEQLEAMIEAAVPALQSARLPVVTVGAVVPFEVGGLQYQSARVTVTRPVTFGGP
jgi:hypothetical protein